MFHAQQTIKNSILYRFLVVNVFAFAMFGAFLHKGWVQIVYNTDISGLTSVMSGLFVVGLGMAFRQILLVNRIRNGLNDNRDGTYTKYNLRVVTNESMLHRVGTAMRPLKYIKDTLFWLGMIATGIGIYVALTAMSGMDPTDFSKASGTIKSVIGAVGTKFFATMAAAAYVIWLYLNQVLLTNAYSLLIADMLEIKEDFATKYLVSAPLLPDDAAELHAPLVQAAGG